MTPPPLVIRDLVTSVVAARCLHVVAEAGVADALGEHVFEWFIRNKRAEWQDYKTQVSQFELDRYLHRL